MLDMGEAARAVLIIMLVGAAGLAIGSVRLFGIRLGVGGVLFAGLIAGHFGFRINPNLFEFVREFGLILFVYAIGLQVGPGFFSSLRRDGLPLNLLAVLVVVVGAALTFAIAHLAEIPGSVAVGIFSGATTNTPALAAAQQALKEMPGNLAGQPALGYAVAYPFGIIGIMLTMVLLRALGRIDVKQEARNWEQANAAPAARPATMNIEVTNSNLDGLPVQQVPGYGDLGVVISRIMHDGRVDVAHHDTLLHVGDVILAVGAPPALDQFRLIVGRESQADLREVDSGISASRIIVTRTAALGKHLSDLEVFLREGVTVTRVVRSDVEFTPTVKFRFQFGDRLVVVGSREGIDRVAAAVGNSVKQLNTPSVGAMMVGIALGILLGSMPIAFPGLPSPIKLGLAGGPLVISILLSRIGNIGPVVWYLPVAANNVLKDLGIILFLACVGINSGATFLASLSGYTGLLWLAAGAAITLIPLALAAVLGAVFLRLNYLTTCGILAGSMTDPPALAFANSMAESDAPSISYATVYPLTMLLRVVAAQILILTLPLTY